MMMMTRFFTLRWTPHGIAGVGTMNNKNFSSVVAEIAEFYWPAANTLARVIVKSGNDTTISARAGLVARRAAPDYMQVSNGWCRR